MANTTELFELSTISPCPSCDDDDDGGGGSSILREGAEIHVAGLVAVIAFYVVIMGTGFFATWWSKTWKKNTSEDIMVAGRNVGLITGIFTMTATWVGGGYINGTAEYVFTPGYGLVWCQAPFGYAISLILSGIFFARKMRAARYVTMLDPFQDKYGRVATAFLYIPALLGDVFWSGAILSALGGSLTVIVGLKNEWAIIISTAVAVLYTLTGGLYSVVFTDVIQFICIMAGLILVVPFAMTHDAVYSISESKNALNVTDCGWFACDSGWLGALDNSEVIGMYLDSALLLIFGGIPWQVYYQRVLSQRTPGKAQILSIAAGFGCIIAAIPPVLIGATAKSTNWTATDYPGEIPIPEEDYKLALPLVMQHLTPTAVGIIGLGAVSAAVMSSADSSILSSSSMFTRNVYRPVRDAIAGALGREKSTEMEVLIIMRVAVLVLGVCAAAMAIAVDSIYALFVLCSDLIFVILFPQLTCVVYFTLGNTYGSLLGFFLGLFFRLAGGEPLIDFPALIEYPYYSEEEEVQYFPFRTLSMLICLTGILVGSLIAHALFVKRVLPLKCDIFKCFMEDEAGDVIPRPVVRKTDTSDSDAEQINGKLALENGETTGYQNPAYNDSKVTGEEKDTKF